MSDKDFYSREYNNRVLFPDHPQVLERWADKSARTRSSMRFINGWIRSARAMIQAAWVARGTLTP